MLFSILALIASIGLLGIAIYLTFKVYNIRKKKTRDFINQLYGKEETKL